MVPNKSRSQELNNVLLELNYKLNYLTTAVLKKTSNQSTLILHVTQKKLGNLMSKKTSNSKPTNKIPNPKNRDKLLHLKTAPLNLNEEYLHDRINMIKWIRPKFGDHDQIYDNEEHYLLNLTEK